MCRLHLVAIAVALTASACVSGAAADPEYAHPDPAEELGQSQGPTYDEYSDKSQPSYAGPPGGEIDLQWQYQYGAAPVENGVDPNATGVADSATYDGAVGADGTYDPNAIDPYTEQAPVADPGPTGNVNDAEIDATLQPYGEWVESAEYGLVWRPYTTVVGADFTPYESCGQWVWTDYGWTFSCDWTWGWLPFHYGNWVYADNSWCWTRGYEWGPAWVDWRSGNDHIGWRPRPPRGRPSHYGHWSFGDKKRFGRDRIRRHWVDRRRAEQSTWEVPRPPVRGGRPLHVRDVMAGRKFSKFYAPNQGTRPTRPDPRPGNATRPDHGIRPSHPRPGFNGQRPGYQTTRPDHGIRPTEPRPGFNAQRPDYTRPTPSHGPRPITMQRPTFGGIRPRDNGPRNVAPSARPSTPSRPSYSPPSRPSDYSRPSAPSRPSYSRPSAPSRPSYSPPSRLSSSSSSRPSYSPPSRPSSSSSRPSSTYSHTRSSSSSSASPPPSRSSGSSAPSRSWGGGGRRR